MIPWGLGNRQHDVLCLSFILNSGYIFIIIYFNHRVISLL